MESSKCLGWDWLAGSRVRSDFQVCDKKKKKESQDLPRVSEYYVQPPRLSI